MAFHNPPNKSKNFLRAQFTSFTSPVFSLAPKNVGYMVSSQQILDELN